MWQLCRRGCAQAWRAPHRRPRAGLWLPGPPQRLKVSAPVTQCTSCRHPDLKVRLATFWTLRTWSRQGRRKHGRGVASCLVMGVAEAGGLLAWAPRQGIPGGLGSWRATGAGEDTPEKPQEEQKQRAVWCLPVFGRQLQASQAAAVMLASGQDPGAWCRLCQLGAQHSWKARPSAFSGAFSTFRLFMGHMASSFLEEHHYW